MQPFNSKIKSFLTKKRILITGAAGFIGSFLTKKIVDLGCRPHILVNEKEDLWRVRGILDHVRVFETNLTYYDIVARYIKTIKPEIIFHLAGVKNVSRDVDLVFPILDIDTKGTLNILHTLVKEKIEVKRVVLTGTCEEYGDGKTPFRESQREISVSPYSAGRTALAYFSMMFNKIFNLPITFLRPFLTYGPKQDLSMFIPSLISHCLERKKFLMTSGEQTREFNHVEDIARAYILASYYDSAVGQIINIGNGKQYRIRDVAEKITGIMKASAYLKIGALKQRRGETSEFYADSKKAKALLHWQPQISFEQGLQETIDWYTGNHRIMKKICSSESPKNS
ncbi:MAG: GDP-mannose 4,6-dehydratase [bacterium]|nr:GDP-mannose 4,6-dehydratase [bacterium]